MEPLPEATLLAHEQSLAAAVLAERPYHAKRPHRKSRAGCQNCKTRKVKCDEARPRCRACTLRRETCVYTAPSAAAAKGSSGRTKGAASQKRSSATASASAPASTASNSTTPAATKAATAPPASASTIPPPSTRPDDFSNFLPLLPLFHDGCPFAAEPGVTPSSAAVATGDFALLSEPLFRPSHFDTTDMKLLWFYTVKGYDAFANETGRQSKVDKILQVTIPQHAFNSPFLMNCLLALSALELRLLDLPIDPHRVFVYRDRAFAGYRYAVENATPPTYPALLACSLLLCALSSQMFRDPDCGPLYILDWMVVWRGIGLVVRLITPDALHNTGLAPLFMRPPIDLDNTAKYIPNQLLFLVSAIPHDDPDHAHVHIYYKTLKYLGSLYAELQGGIGRILLLRIITWFTFLPIDFTHLARQHRPRALVILAHYLIFVKFCHTVWWMRGIADKEICDIRNVLSDEWLPFLAGPLAAIETDDDIAIGKILLDDARWTPGHYYDAYVDSHTEDLSLVDNTGQVLVYDGGWVRASTGEPAYWSAPEPLQPLQPLQPPQSFNTLDPLELCEPPVTCGHGDMPTPDSDSSPHFKDAGE